jgi:hypothetical protein
VREVLGSVLAYIGVQYMTDHVSLFIIDLKYEGSKIKSYMHHDTEYFTGVVRGCNPSDDETRVLFGNDAPYVDLVLSVLIQPSDALDMLAKQAH